MWSHTWANIRLATGRNTLAYVGQPPVTKTKSFDKVDTWLQNHDLRQRPQRIVKGTFWKIMCC